MKPHVIKGGAASDEWDGLAGGCVADIETRRAAVEQSWACDSGRREGHRQGIGVLAVAETMLKVGPGVMLVIGRLATACSERPLVSVMPLGEGGW